jgi:hypothetical protein
MGEYMHRRTLIFFLYAAFFVSIGGCGKKAIEPKQQPSGPVKLEQFKAETKEMHVKHN